MSISQRTGPMVANRERWVWGGTLNQFGINGMTKDGQTPTGDMVSDLHMLYKWLCWFPCAVWVSDGIEAHPRQKYCMIQTLYMQVKVSRNFCLAFVPYRNWTFIVTVIASFLSWCAVDYRAYRFISMSFSAKKQKQRVQNCHLDVNDVQYKTAAMVP